MDVEHLEGSQSQRPGNASSPLVGGDWGNQNVRRTASSTKMETKHFYLRWTIEQFSIQQELSGLGDFLTSGVFGSEDERYKFLLKLFPGGKDDESRGFLSLFLQIHKCSAPKLHFRGNFYMETVDGPRGCALSTNVLTINKGGIVAAPKFYSADTIKAGRATFTPDDALTIGVDLVVFGEQASNNEDSIGPGASMGDRPGLGSVAGDLGRLFTEKKHTDVVLRVGEKEFCAHKAILAARSPVLDAMFGQAEYKEHQNNEARLEDVTPDAVQALLEFIYTGFVDLTAHPGAILAAADKYGVDPLKTQCETALSQDLSIQNVCERLILADTHSAERLRRSVMAFFGKQRVEVLVSEGWKKLEQVCPVLAAAALKEFIISAGQNISSEFCFDEAACKWCSE